MKPRLTGQLTTDLFKCCLVLSALVSNGLAVSDIRDNLSGSIETITAGNFDNYKQIQVENELILKKNLDRLPSISLCVENVLVYHAGSSSTEFTAGFSKTIKEYHTSGILFKVYTGAGTDLAIDGVYGYEKVLENFKLTIADENEFIYHAGNNGWEYINTLELAQGLFEWNHFESGFYLENEFLIVDSGEYASVVKTGPVVSAQSVTLGVYYTHEFSDNHINTHVRSGSHLPGFATTLIFDL